jgi:uncharacterized protein YdeI (YjbR/CyaY-like superfamily)
MTKKKSNEALMAPSSMNPKVDWFFNKDSKWKEEYSMLRRIVLNCGLVEELKWGCPCYTFRESNIVLIHGFKDYCALLFMKGVLLKDSKGILIQQTVNVQVGRQARFRELKEIVKLEKDLKAYIYEAIEVEKQGLKVDMKKTEEYTMVQEFEARLDKNATLKKAFYALTPGRQRGYLYHFSMAKLAKTRETRIEKCVPKIMKGEGFDD